MALELKYGEYESAYLKMVPTTIQEEIIDEQKVFSTFIIYDIKTSKEGEIIFRDSLLISFNPEESIFIQSYNYLKNIYKEAIDI